MGIKKDLGFVDKEEFDVARAIDFYLNNKPEINRDRKYFYVSEVGKSKKEIFIQKTWKQITVYSKF